MIAHPISPCITPPVVPPLASAPPYQWVAQRGMRHSCIILACAPDRPPHRPSLCPSTMVHRSAPARLHYCTHTSLHQCALLENSFVGFKVSFFIKFRRLKKLASVQHPIQLLPAQLGECFFQD
ncbi:hypothetical protein GT037_004030 [Alternaria burnsii]|uniref:Uncharacterized protein n=1 Tax=Alternaria burnsii TaxID=1187904 RepID=A0A8H7B6Z6_9PLEO|nr:uncharacterized protein GT037_004030 [Alternaria burnsii]KAF7678649.1 hypothetical protein GT037_004030 [Alternaria burnsii]